jgi:hypothetical protein
MSLSRRVARAWRRILRKEIVVVAKVRLAGEDARMGEEEQGEINISIDIVTFSVVD